LGQFLLHEDFYDEAGTALQPALAVVRAEDFPTPTLAGVCSDPRLLLDFTITRWHFEGPLAAAWRILPQPAVLAALSERFVATANTEIRSRILTVCASTLGSFAADFVRYAWGEYFEKTSLVSLAEASVACLPYREGLDRVKAALQQLENREKRDLMFCLGCFHTAEALDWIEQNIFEPITESWAYLAAASRIDWSRVERWLRQGRPLSLVAIDALAAIAQPMTPLLRSYGPTLHEPPTLSTFEASLMDYRQRDPVPRVQKRVEWLLGNSIHLTMEPER